MHRRQREQDLKCSFYLLQMLHGGSGCIILAAGQITHRQFQSLDLSHFRGCSGCVYTSLSVNFNAYNEIVAPG